MKQNDVSNWKYDESMNCLLLFAQRINEILFYYTMNVYKAPLLSLRGLAEEFCETYYDTVKGIINQKSLNHIIDEFNDRFQKDEIAKGILTDEYAKQFRDNYGSWSMKTRFENMYYIKKRLERGNYYYRITERLKKLIVENHEKKEIERLTAVWVREVMDCGYDENYVYKLCKEMFFTDKVETLGKLDEFINTFDFKTHEYTVYIGFSRDVSAIGPLFAKLHFSGKTKARVLTTEEVPEGIKIKRQKTILEFSALKACDAFSAYKIAYKIATGISDSYEFYRHKNASILVKGQVVCENKKVILVERNRLLQSRVASFSQNDAQSQADRLLEAQFSMMKNRTDVGKIIKVHNEAIRSRNTNESLLSLWSLLEFLSQNVFGKTVNSEQENEKSNIGNVIDIVVPFLKCAYIVKLVNGCKEDIERWNAEFYKDYIINNGFGNTELEHTFAFLAFEATQSDRNELYTLTENYPLLRCRVATLADKMKDKKSIGQLIGEYEKSVRWNLYRTYRIRNYIVHDAEEKEELTYELLCELHQSTVYKGLHRVGI